MREFSPLDAFEQALRGWWLVVLVTILGGLLGWAVHSVLPPVYEARAIFTVSINFNQTGSLTQFEEDFAWNKVGDLINSTAVRDQVIEQANREGILIDSAELAKIATIERKEYIWVLKVRHSNPGTSAKLVNLWADEANRQLMEAYGHAVKAQTLQRYLDGLQRCIGLRPALPDGDTICSLASLNDVQSQIQATNSSLSNENIASRGIIAAVSFDLSQKATIPTAPSLYGRNSIIMAGAIIGFFISLWGVQVQFPNQKARSLHRA